VKDTNWKKSDNKPNYKTMQKTKPRAVKKTKQKTTRKKTVKAPTKKPTIKKGNAFVATEQEDDKLIVGTMKGQLLPFFVYQYCEEGCKTKEECTHDKITVPTVKGVSEVVHRLNRKKKDYKIKLNPQYQRIENNVSQGGVLGVQVTVLAENELMDTTATGVKFEPYKEQGGKRNEFALEKALSKAERNAYKKIISEIDFMEELETIMEEHPKAVKFIDASHATAGEETIALEQPKKTSDEEIRNTIRRAITTSKNVDQINTINEKTQGGTLGDKFKKEVAKLTASRVAELNKKNEEITYEDVKQ